MSFNANKVVWRGDAKDHDMSSMKSPGCQVCVS